MAGQIWLHGIMIRSPWNLFIPDEFVFYVMTYMIQPPIVIFENLSHTSGYCEGMSLVIFMLHNKYLSFLVEGFYKGIWYWESIYILLAHHCPI